MVVAILVPFPFARRPWALPVLVVLYRPRELNEQEGRRHKTPIELARGLLATLLHWFPEKKFVFLGDGGYASHEFASFFHHHRRRAALVARFHADAALYDAPAAYRGSDGRASRVGSGEVPVQWSAAPACGNAWWIGMVVRNER